MVDWERIQQWLIDFFQDHWFKAASALAAMIGTSLWAFFWAWRSWRIRSDLDVLHISLNTIQPRPSGSEGQIEPWLILDVIYENPLHEVVTHPMPRRLIKHAARQTTESQPFLRFDETDRWYVLNIVRLAIAETCAVATIAKLAPRAQVDRAFRLCCGRAPEVDERADAVGLVERHGLPAFCRALLNTNEFLFVF